MKYEIKIAPAENGYVVTLTEEAGGGDSLGYKMGTYTKNTTWVCYGLSQLKDTIDRMCGGKTPKVDSRDG